jgi:small neutral amino acid transporter SnatA (MarC family)
MAEDGRESLADCGSTFEKLNAPNASRSTPHLFLILIRSAGAARLSNSSGISLPVMQVSGGLVLAAMGWRLLSQDEPTHGDLRIWQRMAASRSPSRR